MKIGDLVTRNSYNNDIVFTIIDIDDDLYYLKGINVRLYADSKIDDLVKYDADEDVENEKSFQERLKEESVDRNSEYFYLPGKILHIDTDNQLSNKPTNPYKIRENSKFNNHKKSQKEQKISNFS